MADIVFPVTCPRLYKRLVAWEEVIWRFGCGTHQLMGVNLNSEITLQFLLRDIKGRKACHTNSYKKSQSTCKFMTLCSLREMRFQDHQLDPTLGRGRVPQAR